MTSLQAVEVTPHRFSGHQFTIPSDVALVEALRDQFTAFLWDIGVESSAVEAWQLIFSEAIVNAIKHGNGSDPDKPVVGGWWLAGQEVFLELSDRGHGPPEDKLKLPSLPEDPLATGGRGLYLIQQFTDRWEHWRGPDGYRTRMCRAHPEVNPEPEGDVLLDQALNELSTAFESLAAFYRLGEGLVNAEKVSTFMMQAFRDLATVASHDYLRIRFTQEFQPGLWADLETAPCVSKEPMTPQQECVVTKADEFVWETPEEVQGDPLLEGYACGICSPVQAGGVRQGLLTIARRSNEPYFNAGELNTIRTFADLIGIAVVSANNTLARSREARALRELEIASEIQNDLLPMPSLCSGQGWDLFARRDGAREVAGDHVEVARSATGELYLVCIDVMGKGVPAAFLAAIFRTAFHLSVDFSPSLSDLADKLNRVLIQQMGELTMFATCAIARVAADLTCAEILNAGHCPVVLADPSGALREVEPSGPPLGVFADSSYLVETLPIGPGEKLVMVTDGLYEWDFEGDVWGWEAFLDFFRGYLDSPPLTFWNALSDKIATDGAEAVDEASDDRTILYWRRTE